MYRVVIKLKKGSDIYLNQKGRFSGTEEAVKLNTLLDEKGIIHIFPIFTPPLENTPEALELKRYIGIELKNIAEAQDLIEALKRFSFIEDAYIEPPTELA